MIPLPTASEFQADKAIRDLKLAINAAENSNQAGEDLIVIMAAGADLYEALKRAEFRVRFVMDVGEPHEYSEWVELHNQIEAALLKAEGK